MNNNEINYKKLLKLIICYLNNNDKDKKYRFEELSTPYTTYYIDGTEILSGLRLYGIIANEKPVSGKTFNNIKMFDNSRDEIDRESARKYLLDNNVIYCYCGDKDMFGTLYWNCRPNDIIDLNKAQHYFRCIDGELLDNVVSDIKQNGQSVLTRKLFKKY